MSKNKNDVSEMAEEPWVLSEDGYLNANTDIKEIVYHPTLNVILICTNTGAVRVLDINTGVVLQSTQLTAKNYEKLVCRYIPSQDRVLFSDGQSLGVRSDYNGVLLLDSILQKIIADQNEEIKIELPLSEAIILKQSLTTACITGYDHVVNELTNVILEAQKHNKKGIKAQKWNTVCLKLPLNQLKNVASNIVTTLLNSKQQTPELTVASAIHERLTELLGEYATDRRAMASEFRRRDTFSNWPHMDYKWALPEQMAQAGFYHQPNVSGDDRVMCFTCSVCLVCWERTDEPWCEHERHSQNCPYLMGEYTQNVPIAVTLATNPALDATYRGASINVLGNSSLPNLMPTSNAEGLISVFDVSGKIKRTHSFFVSQFDSHILEKVTKEFGAPGPNADGKYPMEKIVTALLIVDDKDTSRNVRPSIICGLTVKNRTMSSFEVMNDQNRMDCSPSHTIEGTAEMSCLYLVVYDFTYSKSTNENNEKLNKNQSNLTMKLRNSGDKDDDFEAMITKKTSEIFGGPDGELTEEDIIQNSTSGFWVKQFQSIYKSLVPGENDEICVPPSTASTTNFSNSSISGPRSISIDSTSEADAVNLPYIIHSQDFQINSGSQPLPTITDHINELKETNRLMSRLNYSRAVQCLSLPDSYKNRKDLHISDVLTSRNAKHVVVILKSCDNSGGAIIVYAVDFSGNMVKIKPTPVLSRDLTSEENPLQVILLPPVDRLDSNNLEIEGCLATVCSDGAVRIIELSTLKTLCYSKLPVENFVSVAYCNSLERMCACTKEGALHFYALNDTDSESGDLDHEEDVFQSSMEAQNASGQPNTNFSPTDNMRPENEMRYFYEANEVIPLHELKWLHSLTDFEPLKFGYTAVVPPCWTEFQQAQRQRRHSASLHGDEAYTKTWRLQTDLTTWDEHVFEITFPTTFNLGHVDVHFVLQPALVSSNTTPQVEVTLLRQNAGGVGLHGRKDTPYFSVDDTVTFEALHRSENPVTSQEYLRAHNADILAGPVSMSSCIDLTDHSGVVTLTSPKLLKSRNRTLLLHLRVVNNKEEDKLISSSKNTQKPAEKTSIYDKLSSSTFKEFYNGCDSIHELSITVYAPKHGEKWPRALMLESNAFVQSLMHTALDKGDINQQGFALDILNWIACVRLMRNRSHEGQSPPHQLEFVNIVEKRLLDFVRCCLLYGRRSLAHRCAKFLMTCSQGANDIDNKIGVAFNSNLSNSILESITSIAEINSAAGLQWLTNILQKVATKSQAPAIATECLNLISKISTELDRRTNKYHLILRSRYGLYGTPLEPELFDVDPLPVVKGSSTQVTFAPASDMFVQKQGSQNYSFYKECINPKDIIWTSGIQSDYKIKYKNVGPSKCLRGLIEVQPLHFMCVQATEGSRLEMSDDVGNMGGGNIITVNAVNGPTTNEYPLIQGKGKESVHFPNNMVEIVSNKVKNKHAEDFLSFSYNSKEKLDDLTSSAIQELAITLDQKMIKFDTFHKYQTYQDQEENTAFTVKQDILKKFFCSKEPLQTVLNTHKPDQLSAESVLSHQTMNRDVLLQHILGQPPQQVIVIDRMNSGARRHVILDFGTPVILTDILIPSCSDLFLISIDVWLVSEEHDAVSLVVCTDIGLKNLVLNDLLPVVFCRYLKITVVGKYGMATTRCRIPVGSFYGHVFPLVEDLPLEMSRLYPHGGLENRASKKALLEKLLEDISCRYSLACSKLKEILRPMTDTDLPNAAHLSAYMNITKGQTQPLNQHDYNRVYKAYKDAIIYQRQLNTIRQVMSRLDGDFNPHQHSAKELSNLSTDKLKNIAESLLEILLTIEHTCDITLPICRQLFNGLCVNQTPRLQFLAALFLRNNAGGKNYWGDFLADTISEMFSSSYSVIFPQDRVFTLLGYLSKFCKSTYIVEAALRVAYECLKPLHNHKDFQLQAASIDQQQLSWLLMYLSLQLDWRGAFTKHAQRWEWLFNKMAKTSPPEVTKIKNKKPFGKIPSYGLIKLPLKNTTSSNLLKTVKIKHDMLIKCIGTLNQLKASRLDGKNKSKEDAFLQENEEQQPTVPEKPLQKPVFAHKMHSVINAKHCRVVAKVLFRLVLSMDHSASADMLLISFKIIGTLSKVIKIQLGQLVNEDQLLRLIEFCLICRVPWAPHALACLLSDIVDASATKEIKDTAESNNEMETESTASTAWSPKTSEAPEIEAGSANLVESEQEINQVISKYLLESGIDSWNGYQATGQLPSVYESDDSELEYIMEDFMEQKQETHLATNFSLSDTMFSEKPQNDRGQNKQNPQSNISVTNSSTTDARLDAGVEILAELSLRKLLLDNSHNLVQTRVITGEPSEEEMPQNQSKWPNLPVNLQPESTASNSKILNNCFRSLFHSLPTRSSDQAELILQLWLDINYMIKKDKLDNDSPAIALSREAIEALITFLATADNLSPVTWCTALKTLALALNSQAEYSPTISPSWDEISATANVIVSHPYFVKFLLKLLSGRGLAIDEGGMEAMVPCQAGPSLCKVLSEFLVRLQTRCDVISPNCQLGSLLKTSLLRLVYELVDPNGPLALRKGPLDAQCKLLQIMLNINFENTDISVALSIFESSSVLVQSFVANGEKTIKCNPKWFGETSLATFRQLYSTVLGDFSEGNKRESLTSSESLLITLLKLLAKLVKMPLFDSKGSPTTTQQFEEAMETDSGTCSSQTDERNVNQDFAEPCTPCLADLVLKHRPTILNLCTALTACKTLSLCMLASITQKHAFLNNFSEPTTFAGGVFHVLISLAKSTSNKEFLMEPLIYYLSEARQLSEPLLWLLLQVLDTEETIRMFLNAGGLTTLGTSFVKRSNTPNTILKRGTISTVMQYLNRSNKPSECNISAPSSSSKKAAVDEHLDDNLNLVNFAPFCTIKCNSSTAQQAGILIQGGTTTHRRARTPQWSYHFYPEEAYTELVLTLPNAILLKQVQLQPHSIALNTSPSAVGLEISSMGPTRLVPACPPITTGGMSYIYLELPEARVVDCVLLRLYKPRTASNISLSQIRLMGYMALSAGNQNSEGDEQYCQHSLGWIRLLHHCFTVPQDQQLLKEVVGCCIQVPDLLTTACGLLLAPTHILPDYFPFLEWVVRELSLYNLESAMKTIDTLLRSSQLIGPNQRISDLNPNHITPGGYQSTQEILYQICTYQDPNMLNRISIFLKWVEQVIENAVKTNHLLYLNTSYISCLASVLWKCSGYSGTDLSSLITHEMFQNLYQLCLRTAQHTTLKYAIDGLLCSICYIRPEFYSILFKNIGVIEKSMEINQMLDDEKNLNMGSERTEEAMHRFINPQLLLSNNQLETIALVSRSPTSIKQLLESNLPQVLNNTILEFCLTHKDRKDAPISTLEYVTSILKFFTNLCEEKTMRDWLGSDQGSCFWPHLLHWLCQKTISNKYSLQSEALTHLEEICIRFLSKCCLCHNENQHRLGAVLCEVVSAQKDGITGFLRRLLLQLLLETEKIPVIVSANEVLQCGSQTWSTTHPAYHRSYKRALLQLPTNTTLADILSDHVSYVANRLEQSDESTVSNRKTHLANSKLEKVKEHIYSEVSEISVAAGVLAKDKRTKDHKNLWMTSTPIKKKRYAQEMQVDELLPGGREIWCEHLGPQPLPLKLTLGQLLKMMEGPNASLDWPCVHLRIHIPVPDDKSSNGEIAISAALLDQPSCNSALQVFSSLGGLALLAQHLPTVYPEIIRMPANEKNATETLDKEWIKVDDCDDLYDDEKHCATSQSKNTVSVGGVPPHSLTAFGLFLRLPGYADILLQNIKEALALLRLVLGVTDDGDGNDIFQSPFANTLPTLPFEVLRKLYDSTKLNTDDGRLLRQVSIQNGVIHLLLTCLSVFTHHSCAQSGSGEEITAAERKVKEERAQLYWAKGTGYGTGSTQQSWNVEQALLKQKNEEEHVTVLLQVLASYINPNGDSANELAAPDAFLPAFHDLLANSCLLPALSSYLRNDSVLDMARHIPLYKAVLHLLRAITVSSQLVDLLVPHKTRENEPSIRSLIKNMKKCVDTYRSKLRLNIKGSSKTNLSEQLEEMEQGEGLATLMPYIQDSANLVSRVTSTFVDSDQEGDMDEFFDKSPISAEESYLKIMKNLQFGSFEMITELPEGGLRFVVSHHWEGQARSAAEWALHPGRVKRIAQEAATLASSLPLTASSSVFVRYDTSRLDVMKALITGPPDTPYANGCFEFDVFFPPEYPAAPPLVNLETTGRHSVRFNPNLYNDGKVCLSVLNTWHGRPEEKWNAQTSSFLQVLVSIQSLILVSEPYFNEPGYEKSRGTPTGTQSSREYNATICQATVRWAMLEQILNPCPCFRDVILSHFYLKRHEIIAQVDGWVKDLENDASQEKRPTRSNKRYNTSSLENFKKCVQQLKDEIMKLQPPEAQSEDETPTTPTNNSEPMVTEMENDIEMEKMVNEMCD